MEKYDIEYIVLLLPNGKCIFSNHFNHYYVGAQNNTAVALTNYDEWNATATYPRTAPILIYKAQGSQTIYNQIVYLPCDINTKHFLIINFDGSLGSTLQLYVGQTQHYIDLSLDRNHSSRFNYYAIIDKTLYSMGTYNDNSLSVSSRDGSITQNILQIYASVSTEDRQYWLNIWLA